MAGSTKTWAASLITPRMWSGQAPAWMRAMVPAVAVAHQDLRVVRELQFPEEFRQGPDGLVVQELGVNRLFTLVGQPVAVPVVKQGRAAGPFAEQRGEVLPLADASEPFVEEYQQRLPL
ncbi:MAG: hypothetical protein MZV63_41425 [Marinilabiliales bacterium]|nr:hypothetical protein [Marinilabiliales bacterium]